MPILQMESKLRKVKYLTKDHMSATETQVFVI